MNVDPHLACRAPSSARRTSHAISRARSMRTVGRALAVSVLSTIGISVWAQPAPPMAAASGPMLHRPAAMAEPRMEGPMGHAPGGFMAHHMHGGEGDEMGLMMLHGSPERMGHMIDWMLDGLGATDAQRVQIKQIAVAAATDLKAQHEAGKGMHERAMQLFTAPSVDAGAIEKMRQQSLAQHDQASKRVTQAMLDIARTLTPEQRAKLGERMRDRMARMQDRTARMQKMEAEHPRPPR